MSHLTIFFGFTCYNSMNDNMTLRKLKLQVQMSVDGCIARAHSAKLHLILDYKYHMTIQYPIICLI